MTLCGTRPEYIRLSRIIPKLDELCDHILVDTQQNYDHNLRQVFFDELNIRKPNYKFDVRGTLSEQLSILLPDLEKTIIKEKPEILLVLGDTNSSLGAIVAKRMGVKVVHMEAGNRCYDDCVPEEVNRRIIDHSSDILLPYTERSRQNLLAEGIPGQRIYVTGNPIKEVIDYYTRDDTPGTSDYYLVTLHRQENVDNPERLGKFVETFNKINKSIIWPMHPRTKKQLKSKLKSHILAIDPVGFKRFIELERHAECVLTDSGTVQEECAIFGTSVVTLRDSTERPETIEAGSNFISGCDPERILKGIKLVTGSGISKVPEEYMVDNVSDAVVKIVLSYWL